MDCSFTQFLCALRVQIIRKMFAPTKEWRPADGSVPYLVDNTDYPSDKTGVENPAMEMPQYH